MLEYLQGVFAYSEESPLIFTQFYFWAFFAIVLAVYSVIHKNRAMRNAYLFLVSLFFYYKTSGLFLFILLFSTGTDFFIGHGIYNARSNLRKQLWVGLSVFLNLGVLCYFKYAHFFVENINNTFGTDWRLLILHCANLHR